MPTVRKIIKLFLLKVWMIRTGLRTRELGVDASEIYYVDPARIRRFVTVGKNVYADAGKVVSGNWDVGARRLGDKADFKAFNDRFIRGKAWQETEFYRIQVEKILSGKVRFSCRTRDEFDQHLREVDHLFYRIKEEGYKSQAELSCCEDFYRTGLDEVTIAVGRTGEPLFVEGRHRLAISKIVGVPKIPVRITIRHKGWIDFRTKVLANYEKNGGKSYAPITHYDLSNIPSVHGDLRFRLIRDNMPLKKGVLLDIGSHFGYFCHRFEEEGFDCIAVESDVKTFYFLRKLKEAEGRRFKVINKSIFDYKEKRRFDVVIALNIFYHFLKTKDTYYKLIQLLNRIETKYLFFQSHLQSEHLKMKGFAYKTYDEDNFVDFVLSHSNLSNARLLGRDEDGRAVYMLT